MCKRNAQFLLLPVAVHSFTLRSPRSSTDKCLFAPLSGSLRVGRGGAACLKPTGAAAHALDPRRSQALLPPNPPPNPPPPPPPGQPPGFVCAAAAAAAAVEATMVGRPRLFENLLKPLLTTDKWTNLTIVFENMKNMTKSMQQYAE